MPTQKLPFRTDKSRHFELSWSTYRKPITVSFDGSTIDIPKTGRTIPLPDGSVIQVRTMYKFWDLGMEILRDGAKVGIIPIPSHETRFRTAYRLILVSGGFHVLMGIVAFLVEWVYLDVARITWNILSEVLGLAFLALGFMAKRKSKRALMIAIVLLALEGLILVWNAVSAFELVGLAICWLFLIQMLIQGRSSIASL